MPNMNSAIRKPRVILIGAAILGLTFFSGFYTSRLCYAQRVKTPRIKPVPQAEWTDEQKELIAQRSTPGRPVMNIYTTMANYPELMRDWLTFASHVLRRNSLPERDREILILRIGWLCKSEYEFAQHTRVGKTAGLTDDDIKRIMEGPKAAGLSEHDRQLIQAVDELHKDSFITDATWNALAKTYETKQMMDIVFTVGEYNLVSMSLNSFGVQLEEGLQGFPK